MTCRTTLRNAALTTALFASGVAVAVAQTPARTVGVAATPTGAAVLLAPGQPTPTEVDGLQVTTVRRVQGAYDAQAAALELGARGYAVVAGRGALARAAVAQAEAGGAAGPTRWVPLSR